MPLQKLTDLGLKMTTIPSSLDAHQTLRRVIDGRRSAIEAGLHGQPISSEFIQQANPDIIYVVDRTAVMEHRPVMTAEQMANPLLRQTNAWKNGRVIFVDADAWYITAASLTSLNIIIDDVLKGYQETK